jgi:hypothetical protein
MSKAGVKMPALRFAGHRKPLPRVPFVCIPWETILNRTGTSVAPGRKAWQTGR